MDRRMFTSGALASLALASEAGTAAAQSRRARPKSLPSPTALARAEQALGHRTMYAMGLDIYPSKAWVRANDCSGLVLWCFGLRREDFPGANPGSTNAIYADIVAGDGPFVQTREPRPGGIVIYPDYRLPDGTGDSGHMGLIKSVSSRESCTGGTLWNSDGATGVMERLPMEIYDCSATSWWTFGDAIRVNDYLKFLLHDKLIVQAAKSGVAAADSRRPIYAATRDDSATAAPAPTRRGHCPGSR